MDKDVIPEYNVSVQQITNIRILWLLVLPIIDINTQKLSSLERGVREHCTPHYPHLLSPPLWTSIVAQIPGVWCQVWEEVSEDQSDMNESEGETSLSELTVHGSAELLWAKWFGLSLSSCTWCLPCKLDTDSPCCFWPSWFSFLGVLGSFCINAEKARHCTEFLLGRFGVGALSCYKVMWTICTTYYLYIMSAGACGCHGMVTRKLDVGWKSPSPAIKPEPGHLTLFILESITH